MLKKALFRAGFWLPWAIPLAAITVAWASPLACFLVWGEFGVPVTATLEEIDTALLTHPAAFLILLAVPKIAIYFGGKPISTLKEALMSVGMYFVLPIVSWIVLFYTPAMTFAWALIALTAWIEALQKVVGPRLSDRYKKAFMLD